MNLIRSPTNSVSSMTLSSPFSEKRPRSSCKKTRRNRSMGEPQSQQQQRPLQCRGCEEFLLPQAFAKPQRTKGTGLATCRQCVWKELMNTTTTTTATTDSSQQQSDDRPDLSTQSSPSQHDSSCSHDDVQKLCPTDTLDTVASSLEEQEDDADDDVVEEDDDVSSLAATRSLATTTRTSSSHHQHRRLVRH